MHTILSTQLLSPNMTDALRQAIHPLPAILDAITRAGKEEEGDPLTSTFEALRAMQTSIKQFNPNSGGENSESSSEYTTPAQSQTTSPSHEQSPPPPGAAMQAANATVGTAAKLLSMQNSGNEIPTSSSSPTTSPTHCDRVSSLATHSHHAHSLSVGSGSKFNTFSSPGSRSRGSFPYGSGSGTSGGPQDTSCLSLDVPSSPRRKSDSELQRHRVRPASQQLPSTTVATILSSSPSSGSSGSSEGSKRGVANYSRSIDHAIK